MPCHTCIFAQAGLSLKSWMRRAGLVCLAGLAIVGCIGSSRCCVGEPLAGTWLLPLILPGERSRAFELASVDNISVEATPSDAVDRVSANWLWRLSARVNHSGAKVERTMVTEKALCSTEACRCWVSAAGAGSSATTSAFSERLDDSEGGRDSR